MILLALKGWVSLPILSAKGYHFGNYYGSGKNGIFPWYTNQSVGYVVLDNFDVFYHP